MKKWVLKAAVQKTISVLPLKHRINFLFQKFITKGVLLSDDYLNDRLIHLKNHIQAYYQTTGKKVPLATLELGTGWYPIVPISLFIAGSNDIYSIDLVKLVNKKRLVSSITKLLEYNKSGKLREYFEVDDNRIEQLKEILKSIDTLNEQEILKKLRINLLIQDARNLNLSDNYFDLIHSNNTFEHIPQIQLSEIIKEFSRVLNKANGVMSHFIDMTDHFAHFDKGISVYNFLKFSEKTWKLIDNSIQPQNRLRITDYEEIFKKQNIIYKIINIRNGNLEEFNKIKLDRKFQDIPNDSIAISHCQFISCV